MHAVHVSLYSACMNTKSIQDWAVVESGLITGMGSWCLDRFQRNVGARLVMNHSVNCMDSWCIRLHCLAFENMDLRCNLLCADLGMIAQRRWRRLWRKNWRRDCFAVGMRTPFSSAWLSYVCMRICWNIALATVIHQLIEKYSTVQRTVKTTRVAWLIKRCAGQLLRMTSVCHIIDIF